MGIDNERVSNLLGLLYEGLASPERWADFLSAISRQLKCDKAAIVFHDAPNRKPAMGFQVGLSADAMRDYEAYYGPRNPAAPPLLNAVLRNGSWHGLVRSVVDDRSYRNSEYYDGWGRKHGVFHAAVGAACTGPATLTSLSIMRAEAAGPLDTDAEELLQLLTPHLRRAFQLHRQLEQFRAAADGASAALERLDLGVMMVDGAGRVIQMNPPAEAVLLAKKGLFLYDGVLTATIRAQSCELQKLVQAAVATGAGRGIGSGGAMAIRGADQSPALIIFVTPFRSSSLFAKQQPCALIFLTDPAARPASRASLLNSVFGLTPAECRFADLLLEDLEVAVAADRMSMTHESARFMLKQIFRKTATHRQSQLVRLLSVLPGSATSARSR